MSKCRQLIKKIREHIREYGEEMLKILSKLNEKIMQMKGRSFGYVFFSMMTIILISPVIHAASTNDATSYGDSSVIRKPTFDLMYTLLIQAKATYAAVTIDKPICLPGGKALVILVPQGTSLRGETQGKDVGFDYSAPVQDMGKYWSLSLKEPLTGLQAIAKVYCFYEQP